MSTASYSCGESNSYRVGNRTVVIDGVSSLGYYYGIDAVTPCTQCVYTITPSELECATNTYPCVVPQGQRQPSFEAYSQIGDVRSPMNRYEALRGGVRLALTPSRFHVVCLLSSISPPLLSSRPCFSLFSAEVTAPFGLPLPPLHSSYLRERAIRKSGVS